MVEIIWNEDQENEKTLENKLNWEFEKSIENKVDDAEVDLAPTEENRNLEVSKISIYAPDRDGNRIFYGDIDEIEKGEQIKIRCKDLTDQLRRKNIIKLWRNKKISEIVTEIIENHTDMKTDGIIETDYTIEKYVANEDRAFDIIKDLAELIDYQWYCDDTVFHFEPEGYKESDITLEIGENCHKLGEWDEKTHDLVNHLKVIGDDRIFNTDDSFIGNGEQKEFELEYRPEQSVKVIVDGEEQKGGLEKSTKDDDYSVEQEDKLIVFNEAPSDEDNIEVEYDYAVPIKIEKENLSSIKKYGKRDKKIRRKRLKTIDEAIEFCNEYLDKYNEPLLTGKLRTKETNLSVGEQVRVVDPFHEIDETYIIQEIKYSQENGDLEIKVGSPDFDFWQRERDEYLKRIEELEKEMEGEEELLTKIIGFDESFNVDINQKQFKLEKREGARNSFIIGNNDSKNTIGVDAVIGNDQRTTWENIEI